MDRVEVHSHEALRDMSFGAPFEYLRQHQSLSPPLPWTASFESDIAQHSISVRPIPFFVNLFIVFFVVRRIGGMLIRRELARE